MYGYCDRTFSDDIEWISFLIFLEQIFSVLKLKEKSVLDEQLFLFVR